MILITEKEIEIKTEKIEEIERIAQEISQKLEEHKGIEWWRSLKGLELSEEQAKAVLERLAGTEKIFLLFYLSECLDFLKENHLWIAENIKIKKVNTSEKMLLDRIAAKIRKL